MTALPTEIPSATKVELPQHLTLVLRITPMPENCNFDGDIFGGWVMAQIDLAGAVMAARRAAGRIATIAVNEMMFKQPVRVGDLLSFYAEIVRTGHTSVTVRIEVYAQRLHDDTNHGVKVTEATLTYVATNSEGRPRALPAEEVKPI
jgi:acyl-CoA thioesterase YciA